MTLFPARNLMRCVWLGVGAAVIAAPALGAPRVTTVLETELAAALTDSGLQKNDTLIKTEISGQLNSAVQYTVIPKLVLAVDSDLYIDDPQEANYSSVNGPLVANEKGVLELAEAYLDVAAWNGYWRVGKQQVVWGQADGLKVLDVVNPQDYREFNLDTFEDSRIALWTVNAEFNVSDDATLQLLLIPDATYSKLADAGTPYYVTSSKYRPALGAAPVPVVVQAVQRPHHAVEFGARYRLFYGGWDLTLNYLNHYQDLPVIYRRLEAGAIEVSPEYEPTRLYGTTATNAFGDWVVRMEAGYSTASYQLRDSFDADGIAKTAEFSSVLGLDYRGFTDWFLSYQWFQSTLSNYEQDVVRERVRQQHTFLLRRSLLNETLELEGFVLYSDEDKDGQVRFKVDYQVTDTLRVWSGVDVFYGNQDGQFGQFDDTDRWVMGFEAGF
ncbi:MAG: hypothetical protein CSH49_17890 [Alcanivorax sp.]|nr:DUF1302 family protein [Pseudomonadota bacterium]TNC85371.1 MAG: hypothetical protein CSH49_17890 [Alcanivorax sp.]